MKELKLKTFVLVVCVLTTKITLSQSPQTVPTFVSPNVATLGQEVAKPVSLYTGAASLQIPLYELVERNVKIPISLSYNGSGVHPDEHPGWVGLGWNLQVGGMITRKVKGIPDETWWLGQNDLPNGQSELFSTPIGYGRNTNLNNLPGSQWATQSRMLDLVANHRSNGYLKEAEPDEFIFNFNGYKGRFYFGSDNKIHVDCDKRIKVDLYSMTGFPYYDTNNNQSASFMKPTILLSGGIDYYRHQDTKITGFIVTAEDGTKYYFGYYDIGTLAEIAQIGFQNIELSIDFFQQLYLDERWDTWHLTKIVPPSSDVTDIVSFEYEVGDPVLSTGYSAAFEMAQSSYTPSGLLGLYGPIRNSTKSYNEGFNGRLIRPSYLKRIKTYNTTVEFKFSPTTELKHPYAAIVQSLKDIAFTSFATDILPFSNYTRYGRKPLTTTASELGQPDVYGLQVSRNNIVIMDEILNMGRIKWSKLDEISIYNNGNPKALKSFSFSYNNNPSERLMLKSFRELDGDGQGLPPYSFGYDSSFPLPGYNSNRTDHWGYYNGRKASLFDSQGNVSVDSLTNFKTAKNTVDKYLYSGTLNSVTSPTGEVSSFVYEPNKFNKVVTRNSSTGNFSITSVTEQSGGGLRIKEIKTTDPVSNKTVTKSFTYEPGILAGDNQYYWPSYEGMLLNGVPYTSQRFVTESFLPMSSTGAGGSIGYSKVTEKISGLGKTEHFFSNFDTNPDQNFEASLDPQKSPYSPFSNKDLERGKLLGTRFYDQSNNLIKRDTNYYGVISTRQGEYLPAVSIKVSPRFGSYALEASSYKNYTYPYDLIKTETKNYTIGNTEPVTASTSYEYTDFNSIRSISETNSDNKISKITYSYPVDMIPTLDPNGIYTQMANYNIHSAVVKEQKYGNSLLLEEIQKKYVKVGDHMYLPDTIVVKGTNNAIQKTVYGYSPQANLVSEQKEKAAKTSYAWGYGLRYPIAEIKNSAPNEFYSQNFEQPELGLDFEANVIYDNSKAHTGNYSGRIVNPNATEMVSHSSKRLNISLAAPKKFTFSGWVYSNGPTVQLFLFMMKAGETGYNTYNDSMLTGVTNKWVYIKKEFLVPADVTQMFLRLDNNSIGTVWFDDLRIQPSDAAMSTYTYEPLVGMTSAIDDSGQTVIYEYDSFQRLKTIKNHKGEIIKSYDYHYKQ